MPVEQAVQSSDGMKLPPSKEDLRRRLQQEMREYLQNGGQVKAVPRGTSGREEGARGPIQSHFVSSGSPAAQDQSPLYDVVQSIEARRRAKPKKPKATKSPTRPKRRLIYDDFGEPLRWEWVED